MVPSDDMVRMSTLLRDAVEVDAIETHTEGQVTRTIVDGIDEAALGSGSIVDMRERLDEEFGWIRDFLIKEPRGHSNLVGCLPVEVERDDADLGMIFFDTAGYLDNCGDALIGTTTALIESGRLEPRESIRVETPGGVVDLRISLDDRGGVDRVGIQDMKGFVYDHVDLTVDTAWDDGIPGASRTIPVDIAYGAGNWFGYVDVHDLGLGLTPEAGDRDRIIRYGVDIRESLNTQLEIADPRTQNSARISIITFCDESDEVHKNAIVYGTGSIGRSPCGTGTAGKLALMYDRGDLDIGEDYPHDSLIGTRFVGRILDVETGGELPVTVGEVAGGAHVISEGTFVRGPDDDITGYSL